MSKRVVSGIMLTLLLSGMLTLAFNVQRVVSQSRGFGGPVTVRVVPPLIEYRHNATGKEFTVAVVVENVSMLWGFDIGLSWNTTYLTYVNHTYTWPVTAYPSPISPSPYAGILYEDGGSIFTMPGHGVKPEQGKIAAAVSCLPPEPPDPPMPPFNGSGTVFVLTLKVKYHPQEVNTTIPLHFYRADLAWKGPPFPAEHPELIFPPPEVQDGFVILYAYEIGMGDLNGDGVINIYDVVMACSAYGSKLGDPHWNPFADLAPPWGFINIYDLVTITYYFGKTCP